MEVIHTRSRFSLSTIFRRNEHTIFDLILRLAVIAAVVLTPLVFLTEFRSQFDLHKSLIFSLLTLVAVLAWLAKIVFRKGMRYRRTMLDIPVAVFGLLYVVVTMFSTNWFQSIAGVSNYYQHTLTVMVFTILFFYVIVNNFRTRQEIEALLGSWLAAGVVVTVVSFFQLLGWYPFAADSTHLPDFNLIGSSALALGFYLVSLLPLLLGWMIKAQRPVQRIALFVATVLNFAVLALLDYGLVWYFAIGTLFVYILFLSLRAKKHDARWVIWPTVLLVLAALLIFVDVPSVTGIVPAGEVVLDHATTWEITRSTISDRTLFGTGPENFLKAFVDYRPEAFNDRGLWNLTFIKGSSEFLQLVVTTGILTTLVLLYLLFRHGWSLLRSLISKSDDQPEWFLQLSIWLGWLMVVVLIFFYPFNFVLHFTLWFLMALGISLISESRPQTIEAGSSVSAGFLTSIAFSLIVVLGVVFVYGAGKIWFAEYEFGRGSQAGRSSDYTEAQARFAKAVSLNGRDANFRFALAQSYLNEALALDPEASDSVNRFSELASQAVVEARAALDQSQSNPVDYKSFINLYMILAQVNPIVRADLVPIYDELTVQDPKNPLHWIEAGDNLIALGQLALASLPEDDEDQKAQMIGQANEYFNQAREKYASASELKTDYVIALLKKALVLELIDDTAGAITEIQSLVESYPESVETRYELGRLYQSTEDVEAAKSEYITVLNLSPEHANAAFSLAEISEQQGDTESAVALYSRVLQNNPDNEVVRERLEALGVEIVDEREGASLPSEEEPESIE